MDKDQVEGIISVGIKFTNLLVFLPNSSAPPINHDFSCPVTLLTTLAIQRAAQILSARRGVCLAREPSRKLRRAASAKPL